MIPRSQFIKLLALSVATGSLLLVAASYYSTNMDDDDLVRIVALAATDKESNEFHRVTTTPYKMLDESSQLCAARQVSKHNPHADKFVHVYVNDRALKPMNSGKGKYPEGSLIIKQKFSDANGLKTELFTVMQKMKEGYNPDHGDWEYSVVDATAKTVLARGKIDSCVNCHDSYEHTDYVTRRYMPDK